MKYIVIPKSKLEEVSNEELEALHLSPRYSIDGKEVILKLVHYEMLFPSPMTLEVIEGEEEAPVVYPFPTYEGELLDRLLSNRRWVGETNI